jgi:CO dehydrogenase maturation factor
LCEAKTRAETVAAKTKIREYLRARAEKRGTAKKIAICGKGGVGKSTVVALMANVLSEHGDLVLAIDTDESNPGLWRMLGLDREPKPMKGLLRGFSDKSAETPARFLLKQEIFTNDIPRDYVVEKDNLKFLMVGKIAEPFEGCACSMADLTRVFLGKLILQQGERVVVDMEAGIESFGRGVERSVDTVLMIVEPSYESISLAKKIRYMSDGIGVNTVRAILSKVPSREVEGKIQEKLRETRVEPLGTIFYDLQVNEDAFEGRALGESQAKEDMRRIVQALLTA